jgi:ABC-type branched-subunit amino acid transport system ATPase component
LGAVARHGRMRMSGNAAELLNNEDVRMAYLGV